MLIDKETIYSIKEFLRIKSLRESLQKERDINQARLHHKEKFIWTVVAFYIGGLGALFAFLIKGPELLSGDNYKDIVEKLKLLLSCNCENTVGEFYFIVLSILPFAIFLIMFVLVRTQFQSIYYTHAKIIACQEFMYDLFKKRPDGLKDDDFDYDEELEPFFLREKINTLLDKRQIGPKNPLKTPYHMYLIFKEWVTKPKDKDRKLNGYNKQESVIYCLFFFANLPFLPCIFCICAIYIEYIISFIGVVLAIVIYILLPLNLSNKNTP